MRWVGLILLMAGCTLPAVTPKAKIRQEGAAHLMACMHSFTPTEVCVKQASEWCRARGMERDCAVDDLWGRIP